MIRWLRLDYSYLVLTTPYKTSETHSIDKDIQAISRSTSIKCYFLYYNEKVNILYT